VQVRISAEGEVLIKSPGQMVGYYKRPDLDAEVLTADGFFRTGDRGERRADGLLEAHGPRQGAVQDLQGQVRRARHRSRTGSTPTR